MLHETRTILLCCNMVGRIIIMGIFVVDSDEEIESSPDEGGSDDDDDDDGSIPDYRGNR